MKRLLHAIPLIAMLIGVSTALASQSQDGCESTPQYYWDGSTYQLAGVYGQDFACMVGSGVCSYYKIGSTYEPCRLGMRVKLRAKEAAVKK